MPWRTIKRLIRPFLPSDYRAAARSFTPDAWRYLLVATMQSVGFGVLGTVFAIYLKDAGLSEAVVGDVEGALAIGAAVTCLVLPPLVARVGYRRLMIIAALALGASRLGQALMPSALAVISLGLLYGLGEGTMMTVGTAFLAENAPARSRTHLFSIDYMLRVGGMFVGALLGGFLPDIIGATGAGELLAYQFTIGVGALFMAGSLVPARSIKCDMPETRLLSYFASVKGFASWGRLGRLLVPEMLISFGAGLSMPFVALFLKHQLGASVDQVGMIQAASSVGMAFAAFGAPLMARKLGLVKTVVITQMLSLPFLVMVPLSTGLPFAALMLLIRGVLMNMSWPVYNQLATEGISPSDRPLVVGWVRFGWSIAWFGGSVLGGRLMTVSYTLPWYLTAGFYAAGSLATLFLLRAVHAEGAHEAAV